jgi:hypothetical protein
MMNYLKLILLSISASFLCFSSAFGMDQNFKVDGYHIKVFVGPGGSGVEAHGQISGGKPCESLEIDFDCINTKGEEANIVGIVRNAGGAGTRLFRASKSALNTTDEWSVKDVNVWCAPNRNPSTTETHSSINVIGKGQRASNLFNLREGLTVFKFLHRGTGHCAIWLKDKNGKDVELIANEIGKFTGSKSVSVKKRGKFLVDVEADSDAKWSINVRLPSKTGRAPITKSDIRESKAGIYNPRVKTKSAPETSEKKIKIWEDEKGVIHIEQ